MFSLNNYCVPFYYWFQFFKKIVWISHKTSNHMVVCYPSTPKKLVMTFGCFLAGASLFAVGVHLSYINVAPQQARTKARNDFVKERLRKKYGKL